MGKHLFSPEARTDSTAMIPAAVHKRRLVHVVHPRIVELVLRHPDAILEGIPFDRHSDGRLGEALGKGDAVVGDGDPTEFRLLERDGAVAVLVVVF